MKKKNLLTILLPVIAVTGLILFNALKIDTPLKYKADAA
ncbi:MAG: hypothetical protein JWP44_4732, partial [Mucilaginibacter sp.]|nr:hypothetical protein [Mucilaginibacter sp.]